MVLSLKHAHVVEAASALVTSMIGWSAINLAAPWLGGLRLSLIHRIGCFSVWGVGSGQYGRVAPTEGCIDAPQGLQLI